jgi:uncharacterized cupredoxin-like copper-binding protein
MTRLFGVPIAAFLLLPLIGGLARATDATMVKVALIDISSAMGMGPAGRGIVAPGQGYPPGMMGYGMMTPGQGQYVPGHTGPGMMDSGMMAVRIDHPSVKAGSVRFDVTNWSQGTVHNLFIVAVDSPQAPLPYDYAQAKVAMDQVKVMGGTSDLQPTESATLDASLTPGSYLLICNVPGHYAAGMVTPLTVTP